MIGWLISDSSFVALSRLYPILSLDLKKVLYFGDPLVLKKQEWGLNNFWAVFLPKKSGNTTGH